MIMVSCPHACILPLQELLRQPFIMNLGVNIIPLEATSHV